LRVSFDDAFAMSTFPHDMESAFGKPECEKPASSAQPSRSISRNRFASIQVSRHLRRRAPAPPPVSLEGARTTSPSN
jgi:hypothetical protein